MLLEFRMANFRSICEEQVISFRPAERQVEYPENILRQGRYAALNAVGIYGLNDSGKSNLLKAVKLLSEMVRTSSDWSSTREMPYDPFLLRMGWETKPTEFEITLVLGEDRFRYGVAYTAAGVDREWLFRKHIGREVPLFEREADIIEVGAGLSGSAKLLETAIEATRLNALFLSKCDSANVPEATQLMQWFSCLITLDGLDTTIERRNTADLLRNPEFAAPIRAYLASLSLKTLGVEVQTKEFDEADLPANFPMELRNKLKETLSGTTSRKMLASHRIYDAQGRPTTETRTWNWAERESAGAVKALEMSGHIIWTLAKGGVLVVDEIEAKMHTQLTINTLKLFLSPATNPHQAQLLFATHDTNLLTYANLRRDQICFAEKNAWEGTETYSLSDFRYLPKADSRASASVGERPDTDKEKRYIEGRYGAVPATPDFKRFVEQLPAWLAPEK